jgi:hypothetical protein
MFEQFASHKSESRVITGDRFAPSIATAAVASDHTSVPYNKGTSKPAD